MNYSIKCVFLSGLFIMMNIFFLPALFAVTVDLQVEDMQILPPSPTTVTPVSVTLTIRNAGSASSGPFSMNLHLFKKRKEIAEISDIPVNDVPASGAAQSIPADLGLLDTGNYEIRVIINPRKSLKEINYSNNISTGRFRVRKAAYE